MCLCLKFVPVIYVREREPWTSGSFGKSIFGGTRERWGAANENCELRTGIGLRSGRDVAGLYPRSSP